jgi:drug/metabolite transporter (DMT)-like permease
MTDHSEALDRRGVFLALGAAVLFGLSTPLLSVLATPVQPQLLAGLLYLGSGLGLGSYWLARRSHRGASERPLTRADLPWLGGAILAGGVTAPVLLVLGLTKTAASAHQPLVHTHPHYPDLHHRHEHE